MVLYEDRGPNVAAAVITMLSFRITGLTLSHSIGATNATLALPENQKYHEIGLFWFFMFEVFYCVNIIPVKLSISLALIRIAENRKGFIYVQYGVMTMFTIMNMIAGFYIIFQCNPVSAAWDTDAIQDGAKCNPAEYLADIYYATTAVNIFTDWVTAFMPIPLLWNVQLNRNTKISVICVLGLGFFASISACVRLKYTVNLTAQENYLYALADIVIWGYAENGMGLIVGCLMTLRPLLREVLRLGGDTSHKQSNGTSGAGYGFGTRGTQRRTNNEPDDDYEQPSDSRGHVSSSNGYGNGIILTEISAGERQEDDYSSFETESQKKILITDDEAPGGIMVTRHVKLSRND
ncbi:uncharacterized protein B0T23DRAFT_321132 [Neurospora hispaniola]|uniref:Rhodopsin domain-containing protein n=1 Tax=Neurospora hispaniola TaxID=588809 RepID=A0AAJ0MP85_9PEZI|nr:hypothetical protein B0T23DRAFT_321132 [Neurospora hispaniola]